MTRAVHAVRPNLRVRAYPFRSSVPARQQWLTEAERAAFLGPVTIPLQFFDRISISETVDGDSFRITLPRGIGPGASFRTDYGMVRLGEALAIGALITIEEGPAGAGGGRRQLFAGRIRDFTSAFGAGSGSTATISGGGVEAAPAAQTAYIDYTAAKSENAQKQPAESIARSQQNSIAAVITNFAEAIQELKRPDDVIQKLAEVVVTRLMAGGTYGGQPFASFFDYESALTDDTYTEQMIHVINWINQASFGQTIRYWDLMASFATPPLYELFTTSNAHSSVFVDNQKEVPEEPAPSAIAGQIPTQPPRRTPGGTLVFRKTPWAYLNRADIPESLLFELKSSDLIEGSLNHNEENIISGVHVNLSMFDQSVSLLLNPVDYIPITFEQFGPRVMPVELQGVKFPEGGSSTGSPFQARLQQLQGELASVFGEQDRSWTATLQVHYASRRGLTKGKILRLQGAKSTWPDDLRGMANTWYIRGVNTEFSAADGTVSQSIDAAWGTKEQRLPARGIA